MPIEDIRVNINDSIKKPSIEVLYINNEKLRDEELLNVGWISKIYIINCPEQYLPEKLLPINL